MKTTMMMGSSRSLAGVLAITAGAWALVACGDDSETTAGTGGAGGDGTTASQASSGSPASNASSSSGTPTSTSSGGEGGEGGSGDGGAGGAGGSGAGGEGGGDPLECFPAGEFADLFALETDALCVVARFDAPGWTTTSYGVQPTWGGHGGLLTGAYFADVDGGPITSVELTRWAAPIGGTGELEGETVEIELDLGDDADFGGAQLVDTPDGTVFAYTGEDFASEGGLVFFDEEGVIEVDLVLGVTGLALDGLTELPTFSALASPLATEIDEAGLYGAEGCDEGGVVCGGFPYSLWGDATGPVAVAANATTFAVMTSFDGTQTARGFTGGNLTEGEPVDGTDMFTVGGFGLPLAAIADDGFNDGLLVFQATNADTFLQEQPIIVSYVEDGDAIVAGPVEPLLTLAAEGTPVSLVADDSNQLWVGVGTETGTTVVVLARP